MLALILIISKKLLWMFYQSVVTSILFYSWVCSTSKRDFSRLDMLIRQASSEVGMKLDSMVREQRTNCWPLWMIPAILCTLSSVDSETCSATGWTPHTTAPSDRGSGGRSEEVEYKTWLLFIAVYNIHTRIPFTNATLMCIFLCLYIYCVPCIFCVFLIFIISTSF